MSTPYRELAAQSEPGGTITKRRVSPEERRLDAFIGRVTWSRNGLATAAAATAAGALSSAVACVPGAAVLAITSAFFAWIAWHLGVTLQILHRTKDQIVARHR